MTAARFTRGGRRATLAAALAALLAAGLACATSGGDGPSVSERATSLAQTGQAVLTAIAVASYTPPSPTVAASATIAVTATLPPPTATASQIPPTATPAPTACPKDDSNFVTDVNIPDGTHFAPGASFTKTWRLRNSGPCTWTGAYTLRYESGEAMSGQPVNLPGVVAPGATVDITVALVAPAAAGSYRAYWQLYGPDGAAFGTKPYVDIRVP